MGTAWRIVHARYLDSAFDGEGARRIGGRFNSKGVPVVYTSNSLSLAMLEVLVHVPGYNQLKNRYAIRIEYEDDLVETVKRTQLAPNWRSSPAPWSLQELGNIWAIGGKIDPLVHKAILKVPSVLLPDIAQVEGFNLILNPLHEQFARIITHPPHLLSFDSRLV